MKHTRRSKKGERKNHREKIISHFATVLSGSVGHRTVFALELVLPLPRATAPLLAGSVRLALVSLVDPGLGATNSPGITLPSTSSRESKTVDSDLEVPSISLSFAFDSASLARSRPVPCWVFRVGSSLGVPTSSLSTCWSTFRIFRFVYERVIRFGAGEWR